MYLTPDIKLQSRLSKWSKYLAIWVLCIGVSVLIGWEFDIEILKKGHQNMVVMNPVVALSFVCCAVAFLLLTWKRKTRNTVLIGKLFALVVLLIGIAKTVYIIGGYDLHIDQFLFPTKPEVVLPGTLSNRMAPNTAFCFVLTGIALFVINYETPNRKRPAHFFAVLTAIAGLLSVLGYLYKVQAFYGMLNYVPMAIHTAMAFFLISLSVLFGTPDKGIMKDFTSTFTGSITARRLIPAALVVPAVLGLLRLHGTWMGLYSNEFGVAVFATSIIVIFICLIWYNSVILNKRDAQKKVTDDILQESSEQINYLAGLIQRTTDGIVSYDPGYHIKSWNRGAEIIYGYTEEEVLGRESSDVYMEENGGAAIEQIRKEFTGRGSWTGELRQRRKDGSIVICLISSTVLRNDAGEITGYISVIKDITERKKAEEQIAYLARLVEDTGDAVFSTDTDFRIKSWNRASEIYYGYTANEVIGQPVGDIIRPQVSLELRQARRAELKETGHWKGEVVHLKKDGSTITMLVSNSVTRNETGVIDGFISVCRDISDRKKVETALQQLNNDLERKVKERTDEVIKNERRFRALVENNESIIALIGRDMKIMYRSPSAERITGWTNAEREVAEFVALLHPDDAASVENTFKEVLEHPGKAIPIALRDRHKAGHYVWLEGTAINMLHYPGIEAVIMNMRDVTERKKAEDALSRSEELYRSLFENMLHGFSYCKVIFDGNDAVDFTYLAVNSAYENQTGLKNVTGRKISEVIPGLPQLEPNLFRMMSRVALMGRPEKYETYIEPLDRWFSVSMFSPEKGYFVALNDNITESKKAEQRILDLNIDLEEKVILRTAELKKSSDEMEAFSYSVSHDLRAPLRGIIGFSTILEEDYGSKMDDEAKRITTVIKNNTLKMGRLIDDLLTFSRMGRQDIIRICINTDEMVTEIVDDIKNSNPAVEWVIQTLPDIYGDINTMRQVWINLISNAVKYSGKNEHPRVVIGSYVKEGNIVFYINDNGVGFDQQYADKLFKVFQRLHSVHEFEGTGVGLAIIEKIISKHDGSVWAEGKKEEGATFYFSLPSGRAAKESLHEMRQHQNGLT